MAEHKHGVPGKVKADSEALTGLKEGTRVKALGTLNDGKKVVVRVLSKVLPVGKQLVVRVPSERFVPRNPKDSIKKLQPYKSEN